MIDRIWGPNYFGDTKTLDVHIKRLRSKLEPDSARPTRIVTVRGVGYRYERGTRTDLTLLPAPLAGLGLRTRQEVVTDRPEVVLRIAGRGGCCDRRFGFGLGRVGCRAPTTRTA